MLYFSIKSNNAGSQKKLKINLYLFAKFTAHFNLHPTVKFSLAPFQIDNFELRCVDKQNTFL